jgi:acyl-coenzyme A synthetase/AMP-(fatty) acid ligase
VGGCVQETSDGEIKEGYFYASGREDDVITLEAGRFILEIEQTLLAHEQIRDVVCVGIPNPITEQAIPSWTRVNSRTQLVKGD